MADVTQILSAIEQGDPRAAEQLLPLVYDELRKLATTKMAQEKPGQTLDATGLVHEAYLRLVANKRQSSSPPEPTRWANRKHYFAAAAEAMRRILVDNARRKQSMKRGGDRLRQDLIEADLAAPEPDLDLLALDEALVKLAAKYPAKAELVRLHYFAGLTLDEAAELLSISAPTADRWWAYARAWLHREITCETTDDEQNPKLT